ncbi:MAG: ABC transporter ATP-binding protein [Bacilli bacterium]|nr:ABC transporter ATP-binding protein [Bacilli bacterium]MBN2877215.1 ABC transporter ATP-binding protein [Bacilli bacterium]
MSILEIKGLTKTYPKFTLDHVSFTLEEGYIMGFIGANGAGKTTTLKSMLNLVHPEDGSVKIFGMDMKQKEREIKHRIGFMFGETAFYSKRKLKQITSVVKGFYQTWDESMYQDLLVKFDLDEDKKLEQLSQGMRVKYSITLALSHQAELLILDEPTTGLDPVARDELLELFQELIENGKRSILFSTHITSDLEKCADYITFIKKGKIVETATKDDFLDDYRVVSGTEEELQSIQKDLIAFKKNSFGFNGLIKTVKLDKYPEIAHANPSIDDIMIYYAKAGDTQ